jgi:hypothetical protein
MSAVYEHKSPEECKSPRNAFVKYVYLVGISHLPTVCSYMKSIEICWSCVAPDV